ncbi:hypothetical protein VTK73DRAFT_10171 [Phialemonium thermophilum]|uniref:Uncharacterized protein n=1 Tax=Phialemonium thermophilum TaxID=223376 RepID=A0ABR3VY37_9PEZI
MPFLHPLSLVCSTRKDLSVASESELVRVQWDGTRDRGGLARSPKQGPIPVSIPGPLRTSRYAGVVPMRSGGKCWRDPRRASKASSICTATPSLCHLAHLTKELAPLEWTGSRLRAREEQQHLSSRICPWCMWPTPLARLCHDGWACPLTSDGGRGGVILHSCVCFGGLEQAASRKQWYLGTGPRYLSRTH